MTTIQLLVLITVFLIASVISVITGSTSLITVPIMLQFGVEPRTALATNMLALTLMSIGGTLPFIGKGVIDRRRLPRLIVLTLAGSILGALLVLVVPSKSMPLIISISMIVVTVLSIANRNAGVVPAEVIPSRIAEIAGYIVTFLLGIYGGFFSGGYVTLLTAAYVMLFRMTFVQAIATTKLVNIFSSLVATLIFMMQGIVDYKLGVILGLTMFMGGIIGGHITLSLSSIWLQRIYLTVVSMLAFVTLRKSWQSNQSVSHD
ncbi:MAG: sulfite exporter TauE/SafE family protein [Nostoc sp. DedVER01b]|uniref:sulfite exporter TauE/SafE family protein n=1 Tax=Nostoc sp. DedVER02 TaxID=3075405 RepID=UPI002AD41F36|nr:MULTISPECIES: sulfite exporter TauE/SafE family protein [unclassified Nostoc]MDZ7989649.1 sulfite exporter TauE/SafE family protein [Nostoc sp. DedVER02]MDZ8113385.1 sulfite exporter TauE/SafE family protein [Nostoc sp. DedVER01b]